MQIVRVALIDKNKKTKGCERTPIEFLKSLKCIKSNENHDILEFDKLILEEIHVDSKNFEEAQWLIFENSKEIFEKNQKAFFIGGDYSITYPILKAFQKIEEDPFVIIFDAHLDHGDYLKKLIEENIYSKNIVLVSSRNINKEEKELIKKNKIFSIKMNFIMEDLEGVCDSIMESAKNYSGFFINLDIDCLDPAFAPATEFPEPGGLTSAQLIYLLKRISLLKNFRGAELININQNLDTNKLTTKLGAKLIAEMIF